MDLWFSITDAVRKPCRQSSAFIYGIDLMKKNSLQDKNTVINKLKHIARQKTKRFIGAIATSLSAICLFSVVLTQENPRASLGFTIMLIAALVAWLKYYEAVWSKRIYILIGQDDEPVANRPPADAWAAQ